MENPAPAAPRRLPLFVFGFLFFLIGPIVYAVQINLGQFPTPWYLPLLATVGIGLMAISVMQRRGIVRPLGLALFAIVCGAEWFMLIHGMNTPPYTGPAQVGEPLPAFAAVRADGRSYSNSDLAQGDATILLFFRGRW